MSYNLFRFGGIEFFDTNLQVPLEGGEAGRTVTAGSMLLLTGQVHPIMEGLSFKVPLTS